MIGWLVETLIATTLLMLVALILRVPVRQRFGSPIAYALWSLPVLRLVLPPLPGSWQWSALFAPAIERAQSTEVAIGVLNAEHLPAGAVEQAIVHATVAGPSGAVDMALLPPVVVDGGASVAALLLSVWLAGVLAFLGYHLVVHTRFCRAILRRSRGERTLAAGRVRLIETDATTGPLAFGIWRKFVAFPCDFAERYDAQESDLALAHELGHHARGDLLANWVALVVLALHWFNPVAWRAYRAFRADQEMACDALVLAGRPEALRHAYGRAIVKSAHGGAVSAACHLHTINDLKGRLKMLTNHKKTPRHLLAAGLGGLSVLAVVGLGLTASGTAAAERVRAGIAQTTGVDLDRVDLAALVPQPPAAPVAPKLDAVPAVPPVPAIPGAPAAPPAPAIGEGSNEFRREWTDKEGQKHVVVERRVVRGNDVEAFMKKRKVSFIDQNGDSQDIEVPEFEEADCGPGEPVIEPAKGKGGVSIICTDRIEKMAADAVERSGNVEQIAMQSKKMGLDSALMGLRTARQSIAAQTSMSAEQRQQALAGIDEAIVEVEAERDSDN